MGIEGFGDTLTTAGLLHAEVIDVNFHPIRQHGAVPVGLDLTEAVTQYCISFQSHENGTLFIRQQFFQILLGLLDGPGPENIRPDPVMDVTHLVQKPDEPRDVTAFSLPDGHFDPSR